MDEVLPATTVEVLASEYERLARIASDLAEPQFALPTRCPPWDVKALLAHVWIGMGRLRPMLAAPPAAGLPADAAAYYRPGRRREPPADAARVASAQEAAATFATGRALAEALRIRGQEAVTIARRADGRRAVLTRWGDCIRLDDFLVTRVAEAAVHGLDLTDALGRPPEISPGGARIMEKLLSSIAGSGLPPPALGWDVVTFIEKGTGRRALDARETAALGGLAGRFPLLA